MRKPRGLRPGDRVAVVAPASPFPREDFDRGIAEVCRLGYEPVVDDRVLARDGYLAGDAASRARSLIEAWRDPSIAAVFAARGGYGSVLVLPLLPASMMRDTPKIFVGASDLTAVLGFLNALGLVAVHGPMVAGQLGRGPTGYDARTLAAAVVGPDPAGDIATPDLDALRSGEALGPLVGGNLTQVAASLGTPYAFDPPDGCVLFLEDVGERPYRIDRLFTQLRLSGVLARARALVFGEMPGCDEADGSVRCRDVVRRLTEGFPGPVVYGLPAGHTSRPALSLPLGVTAHVVAGASVRMAIVESAVERGSP